LLSNTLPPLSLHAALPIFAHDVFLARRLVEHGLPLDAGRKAGAAATPQPGLGDFGHDLRGLHAQRIAQTGQASETGVFVQREGIDRKSTRLNSSHVKSSYA